VRLTERELAEMEERLRFSLKTLLRKILFIDKETAPFLSDEDKVALANEGIDEVLTEFTEYMRTRVKPDGTAD
jgi:hypothetical protein